MYNNLKKAVKEHEQKQIEKFVADLKKMTVGEVLGSWYFKAYATPKVLESLKEAEQGEPVPAPIVEKMTAKKTREEQKETQKRLDQIAEVELYEQPETVRISVEFKKSRTWGFIPHATVTGEKRRSYGKAGGCGYDKESAAIAYAINENPEVLRILYDHAEKGLAFPYSVRIWAGIPSFDGGCGVSCFYNVFEECGYKFEQVANGKTFSAYTLTRKF